MINTIGIIVDIGVPPVCNKIPVISLIYLNEYYLIYTRYSDLHYFPSGTSIVDSMVRIFVLGLQFVTNVTVFCTTPDLPSLLNATSTFPSAPAFIGSLGKEGTVHPQLPCAEEMTRSEPPVFLKTKE